MTINIGTLAELVGPGSWTDAVYVEVWHHGEITDFRPFATRELAVAYAATVTVAN